MAEIDASKQKYSLSICSMLNSCAEVGAKPLRFFTDKGMDTFAVYLADEIVEKFLLFGPHTGIKVSHYFGHTDHKVVVGRRKIECKSKIKKAVKKTYCLFSGPADKSLYEELKQMNYIPVNLVDILKYSLLSVLIFDKLTDLLHQHKGIQILIVEVPLLDMVKNKSEWEQSLVARQPLPEGVKKVFSRLGYNDEYIKEVTARQKVVWNSGFAEQADRSGSYSNCRCGVRVTTDTPDDPDSYVYFCGQSQVFGHGVDDSNTLPSVLQRELNTLFSRKYEVINRANGGNPNYIEISSVLHKTKFCDNDIIIILVGGLRFTLKHYPKKFPICRPVKVFHRPHDMGEIFFDRFHFTSVGSNAVGRFLFQFMCDRGFFQSNVKSQDNIIEWVPPNNNAQSTSSLSEEETADLMRFIAKLQEHRLQIGSIVMNCNPFTLGHRYLIEYAAARVERLYVFVVEEDRSFFKFLDRLELVQQGTADLDNVVVIPSGRFIISQRTFEAYSAKEDLQDKEVDPSMDIELFARYIAPSLGINIRFAGEEPLDNVTRQYNAMMRRLLPQYGVEFEVIARKESGGGVISASRVRELLKNSKFDEIAQLVPESTLNFLRRTAAL